MATASARIYRSHGVLYGCVYRRPHRVLRLGEAGHAGFDIFGQRNIRLAGHYVAFDDYVTGKDLLEVVDVVDLRTGLHKQQADTGGPPIRSNIGIGPTTALVLHRSGSVAWIVQDAVARPAPLYQVHIADGTRRQNRGSRLLDEGTSIDPSSLAASVQTLYWQNAGQARTAPFR